MNELKIQNRLGFFNKLKIIFSAKRVTEVIAALFFLLFLYAAAAKLMTYQKFVLELGQSPMLTQYAGVIAWFIPAIEVLIAVLLINLGSRLIGLYASFGLMMVFTAYIYIILKFTERTPCSCGGILEKMGWYEHLYFNLAFILLSVVGIVFQSRMDQRRVR